MLPPLPLAFPGCGLSRGPSQHAAAISSGSIVENAANIFRINETEKSWNSEGEHGSLYPESFSPDLEEEGEECGIRTPLVSSAFTCESHSMVLACSPRSALFCFSGRGQEVGVVVRLRDLWERCGCTATQQELCLQSHGGAGVSSCQENGVAK